ncbi:MAG TPA: bifunctional demethylmenaquinone methyltransferase/2-methoxy-6-polyprenyl-1,4-benzoquinol methylase UbiE [Bryobacteraceae bacterium]|nr:bifunctional demethylmenaquinone methyltransferase/2-methoxy-6-polyprenyl-1,4-benzoquinol methylase UbiE [Bryobacteraceae bacterium]
MRNDTPARGTTPPGTANEHQASQWVQDMFAGIAPKYDRINHILSFNIDRAWRKRLMKQLASVLNKPDAKILDLCCGTGDVLLDFQAVSATPVIGADFCHPMLVTAQHKAQRRGWKAPLFEADALQLPLADGTLDAIAISFGFRNLANYGAGLGELHRVLKTGGQLAILEFSHPPGALMKAAYGLYSNVMLPAIGTVLSGSGEAYRYLPDSIRKFPRPDELGRMMSATGFAAVRYELLTGGIAALHIGTK